MQNRVVALSLLLAAASLARVAPVCAGDIAGRVTFLGQPRQARQLEMDADGACLADHATPALDEKFVVGAGAGDVYPLANVFVYVKGGLPNQPHPVPAQPVLIDQRGCTFVPHVAGVQVGQEVQFRNSDDTMHNVDIQLQGTPAFNRGMPGGSPNVHYVFPAPAVMAKVKCDAHGWMTCYIGAVPHPFFAVTGPDGKFAIAGLADGAYELEFWQELLGKRTLKVTVSGGKATADFQYTAGAPPQS